MIEREQRDILFEACKKIATNRNCPAWIESIIREAVSNARSLKEPLDDFNASSPKSTEPLKIGDIVKSNIPKDVCKYKIISEHDPIQGIRLFTVQIIEGDINNPVGVIVSNVPETKLVK